MNVMFDLETMGSGPDAAIVAIGAVEFDTVTALLGRRFYRVVNLASAVAAGGVIAPSTVLWWMRQGDRSTVTRQPPIPRFRLRSAPSRRHRSR